MLVREAGESPILGSEYAIGDDRLFILTALADNYAIRLIEHGQFMRAASLIQESLKASETRGFRIGVAAGLSNWGGSGTAGGQSSTGIYAPAARPYTCH